MEKRINCTTDIVTGGENARILTTCKLDRRYCCEVGFCIDDMGCLDAADKLPQGRLFFNGNLNETQQGFFYRR